ncbi:YbaK/aminoacyl-tRNA synthetase-associated domain isoform 2 [Hibiscus syriacus]|uniref:YbaK/aminoacyl-tRNA synthetase-associated domain isoform 2 n=1 Tax=Hibiscus syriacus TaxID=106335 RepID=A0A6A3BHS3_HIBSY|nr:prolyl-tRNA synthetase associated domain-containing protein 1-like [Hibiscus syriacus]KAE8715451.1 YbaK/aminoacyl-tRNA synthetase-associated domain isoform 2 [Hibiscus syriacus]
MGYSKDQLLALLKELQIKFSQYEHPVVLTVEAQAKYVGNTGGVLSKNLFMKDKKHRYYVVSALADTKVDLKVLSQRLGLGKGGLRMAPEEALGEILQVPLGCVTPFAVVNESARHVSLLLDQEFKSQECCIFHPLSNDMSISLNTQGLDKFLKSIGRNPSYIDLEANPSVGKDQPPDLAAFVPSDSPVLSVLPEKAPSSQDSTGKSVGAATNSAAVTAKAVKPSGNAQNVKEKPVDSVQPSIPAADAGKFVEELLDRASALLLSEISEDSIKQHDGQLGVEVANNIKKCVREDLKNLATIFKNTAYTEGFYAGTRYQPKRL